MHELKFNVKPVRLDLPSLYKISTSSDLSSFEFTHPHTVTHLVLEEDHESIVQFVNLEYLKCMVYHHEWTILPALSKLKELHHDNVNEIATMVTCKQRACQEIKMAFLSMRKNCKMVRSSPYRVISFQDLLKSSLSGKPISSRLMSFLPSIDFDQLAEAFSDQIPMHFKKTFSSISSLNVCGPIEKHSKLFSSLIHNYPNIYLLRLNSAFDGHKHEQSYYNWLPSYCENVRRLEIKSGYESTPIDLNFVLRFRYLQRFETNLIVNSDFIRLLFETLKYFQHFKLTGGNAIEIRRIDKCSLYQYHIQVNEEKALRFFNFDALEVFYQEKTRPVEFIDWFSEDLELKIF